MAKRRVRRVGDVYCAVVDGDKKRYFQYVGRDLSMLGTIVIRVFKTFYDINDSPSIEAIVNDEVDFWTHAWISDGWEAGYWDKVGNVKIDDASGLKDVIFAYSHPSKFVGSDVVLVDPMENWWFGAFNCERVCVGRFPSDLDIKVYEDGIGPDIMLKFRLNAGYKNDTDKNYVYIKRVPYPHYHSYVKREIDGVMHYFHFKGEYALEEVVMAPEGKVRLTETERKSKPAGGSGNVYTLYADKFGDINWKCDEFITKDEFESAWNS